MYYKAAEKAYYYSTFGKVLKVGKFLPDALAVIDEPHAFLKETARISDSGISSPYEFVKNTFKVIGMSATFGGD